MPYAMSCQPRTWLLILLVACGVLVPQQTIEAVPNRCVVQVSPLVFPPYNPLSPLDAQARGTVIYNCTQSTPIRVLMAQGTAGSGSRQMNGAGKGLSYNLFQDAAGEVIWGDGTSGDFYSKMAPPPNVNIVVPFYARIPARQTQSAAGTYSDSVVVTIITF